jgi:hypothetical protein
MTNRQITTCVYSGNAMTSDQAERRASRERARSDRAVGARLSYRDEQIASTLAMISGRRPAYGR